MVRRCAVPECPSTDATNISHRFPRNHDLASKWQKSLYLDHIELDHLMKKYVVCSDHFAPSDYRNAQSKHLNTTAMPQRKPEEDVMEHNDYDVGTADNHVADDFLDTDDYAGHHQDYEAVASASECVLHDNQSEENVLHLADDMNFKEYIEDEHFPTPTLTPDTNDDYSSPGMQSTPAEHEEPPQHTTTPPPIIPSSDVQAYLSQHLQLQTDTVDHQDMIMQMDLSDGSCLLDLPDQLLVAAPVEDPSDDENSDSYVYVMEMHVPDAVVSSDRLPTVLLDGESQHGDFAIDSVPALSTDMQINCEPVAEPTTTTTATTDEVAINCLLSALAEPVQVEQPQSYDAASDDEPYALRDTPEVRLYNEMSKRSLIQLLVAANLRNRDLEQRLGTIESAHAKVLGSLEIFRSVLKR